MDTIRTKAVPQRKVGILLFIGILFLPIVFAWFLLRKGHSTLVRVLGFVWLIIFIFWLPNSNRPSSPVNRNPNIASAPASLADPAISEPVNHFAEDTQAVEQIEQRLKDNRESLKNHYSTPENIKQAGLDIIQLTEAKVTYGENGESKEEKALGKKAAALVPQVSRQVREMYASSVEEIFIKNGMDVQVSARGADKKQLRISYVLMSQPLVYKFQNEIHVSEQASPLGFTKLVYTNGFESSLGKTWTIDL
ncbi:MAG: hypothetical protein WCP97_09755 [bacterium]